jgi:hypothetical protein
VRVAGMVWRGVSRAPLLVGVAAFAVAMAAWVLDNSHIWCTPTSSIQGHAFWHVLGALATAGVFAYYRDGFAARGGMEAWNTTMKDARDE